MAKRTPKRSEGQVLVNVSMSQELRDEIVAAARDDGDVPVAAWIRQAVVRYMRSTRDTHAMLRQGSAAGAGAAQCDGDGMRFAGARRCRRRDNRVPFG